MDDHACTEAPTDIDDMDMGSAMARRRCAFVVQ